VTHPTDALEIEAAKLDPEEEQSMADETYAADIDLDETDGIYAQN
jgi:hypothetical protein